MYKGNSARNDTSWATNINKTQVPLYPSSVYIISHKNHQALGYHGMYNHVYVDQCDQTIQMRNISQRE